MARGAALALLLFGLLGALVAAPGFGDLRLAARGSRPGVACQSHALRPGPKFGIAGSRRPGWWGEGKEKLEKHFEP
uniref:CD99 molecule (Xg blood group) n=1 Tax=Macaca nemestrina TaxID=9545 RepID=A0A2K6C1C7_MACNE